MAVGGLHKSSFLLMLKLFINPPPQKDLCMKIPLSRFIFLLFTLNVSLIMPSLYSAQEAAPVARTPLRDAVQEALTGTWDAAVRDTLCDEDVPDAGRKEKVAASNAVDKFIELVTSSDDSREAIERRRFVGEQLARVYYEAELVDEHARIVRDGQFVPKPRSVGGVCSSADITPLKALLDLHTKNKDVLEAVWCEVLKRYDEKPLEAALTYLEARRSAQAVHAAGQAVANISVGKIIVDVCVWKGQSLF